MSRISTLPTLVPVRPGNSGSSGKVWTALMDEPGATAAELATTAGVGRSTAGKLLAAWEAAGHAVRISGSTEGPRRMPDRWNPAPSAEKTGATTDTDASDADAFDTARTLHLVPDSVTEATSSDPEAPVRTGDEGDATNVTALPQKRSRLAKGALRGMVEDYLRDNPGEHGPSAIGKELNRSGGAVANALEKLVADGYARRVSEAPKRYAALEDTGAAVEE